MKNLPMDLLRAFVTVIQFKSFTKAGELLGRSQPAVSLQISRLEQLLDETLLIREGKNMELSNSGEQFYDYANQILALNDQAISQFSRSAVIGKIRLGIPSEFATVLLPKIVSRFAKAYPNVTLEVNCELSKTLLSKTGRTNHDVILALQNNPEESTDKQVKIDKLVWVSNSSYNSQKSPTVPLIVAPQGCIYRDRAVKLLNSIKQPWQIIYNIPDLTGIQQAIMEGLGVTVLARSTVPEELKILPTSARYPDLGSVGITLITGSQGAKKQAAQRLVEYLKTGLT
jgi:DNA-binding transcriptional LysR family regulator